jgi:hypothetical protein
MDQHLNSFAKIYQFYHKTVEFFRVYTPIKTVPSNLPHDTKNKVIGIKSAKQNGEQQQSPQRMQKKIQIGT